MKNNTVDRRQVLGLLAGALTGTALAQGAVSLKRPVTLVVPYAAGGAADVLARAFGEHLSLKIGQPVIVDNKPGASGNIGMAAGARSSPDGHTLTILTHALVTNPHFFTTLPYQVADFAPVSMVTRFSSVLVVHPSSGYKDLRALLDDAKASPRKLLYSSAGAGSSAHLAAAMLEQATGIQLGNVPYKGEAPAVTALLANEVPMSFSTPGSVLPHIASGRLVALGVTAGKRLTKLPSVPAIAEAVPAYESVGWFGFAGPKGMPRELVSFYAREIAEIAARPDIVQRLNELNFDIDVLGPDAFQTVIQADSLKYGRVIKALNIKLG